MLFNHKLRWIGEQAAEAAAWAARLWATGSEGVTCHKPGESGARPGSAGSLGVAGRGALVLTGVTGRGAEVSDPARPCQPWRQRHRDRARESVADSAGPKTVLSDSDLDQGKIC